MAGSPLPFPDGLLDNGLVLGHTTHDTARVWVRCQQLVPHRLTVSSSSAGVRSLLVTPQAERDQTALLELSELLPDHTYSLDLLGPQGRSVLAPGLAPQLRTLPRDAGRLCFGFMSCSLPLQRGGAGALQRAPVERLYDDMLQVLSDRDARFVLNLGDQIYTDEFPELNLWSLLRSSAEPQTARARELFFESYRGFWATPALQRLRARIPQYMIWDDHEIRDDWGSRPLWQGSEGRLESALWAAAQCGYETYQHALNPATEQGVFHYSFRVGDSCFFVLDLRGQRSWERAELMGEKQWHDLTRWLEQTQDARRRFVVSSIPLHHAPERLIEPATRLLGGSRAAFLVPSTFYDRWCAGRFVGELERLLSLLHAPSQTAAPVIVLAGDIHIGAALTQAGPVGATPIAQWISSAATTSSPLALRWASWLVLRATNLATSWPVRHQFEELRNNFGVVEVEASGEATFHLYAWNGRRTVLAHSVSST